MDPAAKRGEYTRFGTVKQERAGRARGTRAPTNAGGPLVGADVLGGPPDVPGGMGPGGMGPGGMRPGGRAGRAPLPTPGPIGTNAGGPLVGADVLGGPPNGPPGRAPPAYRRMTARPVRESVP